VDYTDPNRINSTILKSNVKVIDPNTAIIYSCPVLLPGQDDATSVFVAPRDLGIKAGDVLSSAQAGGVMHKVTDTTNTGKIYTCTLRESVISCYSQLLTDLSTHHSRVNGFNILREEAP